MIKKQIFLFLLIFKSITISSQVITTKLDIAEAGSWFCFRNSFHLDSISDNIVIDIAADSKYWLWINGELEIREGGLKRGPNPNDTYYDKLENLKNLQQGNNRIAILVWYFGKDGFSHKNSATPGITFK